MTVWQLYHQLNAKEDPLLITHCSKVRLQTNLINIHRGDLPFLNRLEINFARVIPIKTKLVSTYKYNFIGMANVKVDFNMTVHEMRAFPLLWNFFQKFLLRALWETLKNAQLANAHAKFHSPSKSLPFTFFYRMGL